MIISCKDTIPPQFSLSIKGKFTLRAQESHGELKYRFASGPHEESGKPSVYLNGFSPLLCASVL